MLGSITAGMPEKKASKAASPPAEAPIPTMGNCSITSIFDAIIFSSEAIASSDCLGGSDRTAFVADALGFIF